MMRCAKFAYLEFVLHHRDHRLDGELKLAIGEAEVGTIHLGSSSHLDSLMRDVQ